MQKRALGLGATVASALLQIVLAFVAGRTVFADATCSTNCDTGPSTVQCSASGTGCSCDAQENYKCEASCSSGGDPDIKYCEGPAPF